jgi:hypothetical protein
MARRKMKIGTALFHHVLVQPGALAKLGMNSTNTQGQGAAEDIQAVISPA